MLPEVSVRGIEDCKNGYFWLLRDTRPREPATPALEAVACGALHLAYDWFTLAAATNEGKRMNFEPDRHEARWGDLLWILVYCIGLGMAGWGIGLLTQ